MLSYNHTGEKYFGGAFMQLDLGKKIRELRQRDGRTQETLAEAIGVTSQLFRDGKRAVGIPIWR